MHQLKEGETCRSKISLKFKCENNILLQDGLPQWKHVNRAAKWKTMLKTTDAI